MDDHEYVALTYDICIQVGFCAVDRQALRRIWNISEVHRMACILSKKMLFYQFHVQYVSNIHIWFDSVLVVFKRPMFGFYVSTTIVKTWLRRSLNGTVLVARVSSNVFNNLKHL